MNRIIRVSTVFIYETVKAGKVIDWSIRCYDCGHQSFKTEHYKQAMWWARRHAKSCGSAMKRTNERGEHQSIYGVVKTYG